MPTNGTFLDINPILKNASVATLKMAVATYGEWRQGGTSLI
jgi:hypothetical protein